MESPWRARPKRKPGNERLDEQDFEKARLSFCRPDNLLCVHAGGGDRGDSSSAADCFRAGSSRGRSNRRSFGRLFRHEFKGFLVADRGSVALLKQGSVELDRSARDLNPSIAALAQLVVHFFALTKESRIELGILMDADGALFARRGDDEAQAIFLLLGRESPLLVAGRDALFLGRDPDLEEMNRLFLGMVELAVKTTPRPALILWTSPGRITDPVPMLSW